MKLKDVMTREVFTLPKDAQVKEVADQMKKLNVGAIPIVENGKPVGIITDRDIVLRTISENKDPFKTKAHEIMSVNLICGTPDMDAGKAADLMSEHQIRRLPVVENGQLVGIVSLGDLAVHPHLMDEAKDALTDISTPAGPNLQ